MKLTEMSNDQATDAMVRIASALSFICEDEDVIKLFRELGESKGNTTLLQGVSNFMPKITALAFRKHKDSLYEIVGALSKKTKKEVGNMNFMETVQILRENWECIRDFFPFSGSLTEETES